MREGEVPAQQFRGHTVFRNGFNRCVSSPVLKLACESRASTRCARWTLIWKAVYWQRTPALLSSVTPLCGHSVVLLHAS